MFSNKHCLVERSDHSLVPEDSYHPALLISLTFNYTKLSHFAVNDQAKSFNFKKANFQHLYSLLLSTDWSYLTSINDVNTVCSELYDILNNAFKETVPTHKYIGRRHRRFPPWFNGVILFHLRKKSSACKNYEKHNVT